jgi:antitoxin component of MazEF toxin-antitoxin module
MIQIVTLKKIGGSVGAILPTEMLESQHLGANVAVFVMDTPQGILLAAVDPATATALDAYSNVAAENRAAMSALAKQ